MIKIVPVTFSLPLSGVGLGIRNSVDAVAFSLASRWLFILCYKSYILLLKKAVDNDHCPMVFDWLSNAHRNNLRTFRGANDGLRILFFLLVCGWWSITQAFMYVICMSSSTQFTSCELTSLNCKIGDSFCQKKQNLRFLRPIALYFCLFVSLWKCLVLAVGKYITLCC